MPDTITKAKLFTVSVTPKTVWTFVRLTSSAGLAGVGEATLTGREQAVAAAAKSIGPSLVGRPTTDAPLLFSHLPFTTLPEAAFSSAVMQAMQDLEARSKGVPIGDLLGGMHRSCIPTYANFNRRTLDRSPEGFAASAADAVNAGHRAFKIAPFDDLAPALSREAAKPLIAKGIERIEAVRQQIGPDKRLMVDCHWRFQTDWALETLDAIKPIGLYWFECPIPETPDLISDLVRIRKHANSQNVLLAGMENAILREGFTPFLKAGAYNVMMPDVKYAGGPDEMMRIAEAFAAANVTFSPHNPSGPICHAHSLQICAALPDLAVLETQFDETPRFDELVGHNLPPAHDGAITLSDSVPGAAADLSPEALERLQASVLWLAAA